MTDPGRPATSVSLRAGSATSAGRVRTQNQDRALIVDDSLYIVADGMGGHVGGEVAAQVTVDTMATLTSEPRLLRSDDIVVRVEAANRQILARAERDPDLRGMGTTITGLALVEGDETSPALLLVLNVGDSRTYWLRGGELEQLTDDHSVVGELIREGKLTPTDARTHRSRSVLTRALGVEPDVECDVLEVAPIVGDRFLICSDGLPTELTDALIAATLRRLRDPQEAASALVREAVDHGGRDNVTVIVVDVVNGLDGHEATETPRAARPVTQVDTTADATGRASTAPPASSPRGPRRPWIVNLRVLLFFGVVAAIVGVVVWTLRNAPPDAPTPTPTTVVATTVLTTAGPSAVTTTTAPSGTRGKGTTTVPSSVPDTDGPGVAAPVGAADPVPGAVVDPFATTTTTITPTSTTKRKRGS